MHDNQVIRKNVCFFSKRKEQVDKQIEDQWCELEQRKLEEYDQREAQKLEALHKKKQDTAHVIKQQLFEFKLNHIKKLKNDRLEGEVIK